jgi:hypothetical protein
MTGYIYEDFLAAMEKGKMNSLHTSANVSAAAMNAFSTSWQTHPVPHASASFILPVVKPVRLVYVYSGERRHLTLVGKDPMTVSMIATHLYPTEPTSPFEKQCPGAIDITLSMRVNNYTIETIKTE